MAFADRIDGKDVQAGDTICVVGSGSTIFHNMEVTTVTGEIVRARHINSEGLDSRTDAFSIDAYWKFYLVERPKKPLPTKLGAVIESGGVEWVLCDPRESARWYSPDIVGWRTNEYFADRDWEEVV